MTEIATVYAVFGSTEEAESIGRQMVERRLAACVNIMPACRSLFRWKGAIAAEEEVPALFKTTRDGMGALISAIADLHSYDVPAICVWPIATAHPPYGEWVGDEVRS